MRLVLMTEGVKREISAPFKVAASISNLIALRDQLTAIIDRGGMSYGWVTIWPMPEETPPNTPPLPWRKVD